MSKFYCNVCKEDVTLQDGKCPKCKTNWKKEISDSEEDVKEEVYEVAKEITNEDIEANISFFLKFATVVEWFFVFLAIIAFILAFVLAETTDGLSFILLAGCVGFVILAFIFANALKWMAYMLHTNYKRKK